MSSVQPVAAASFAASRRPDTSAGKAAAVPAKPSAEAGRIPVAFTTPRAGQVEDTPPIPPMLDIKNIKRANAYADPFGMPVDPTKDIAAEGAASLYARYDKEASQVIERICKAEFKLLLDVKV